MSQCGNGRVDAGEHCDDGNRSNGDGCSSICLRETAECQTDAECPSGRCQSGRCLPPCQSNNDCLNTEQCVGGVCVPNVYSSTPWSGYCGNGTMDQGEACDDGNSVQTDRCTTDCRRGLNEECSVDEDCATGFCLSGRCAETPLCGNGTADANEECDDGNRRDADGCNAACRRETGSCGDGIVEALFDEQCEPSLHDPSLPFQCDPQTCRYTSQFCGNGNVNPGEQCDLGTQNSDNPSANPYSDCRTDCSRPRCGDQILDALETCDDGNRVDGDGCSRYCQVQSGAGTQSGATEVFDLPLTVPGGPLQNTGPGVVAAMAAGAAAGWAWIRRRRL